MGQFPVYTENSWFEWDDRKARRNREKHGVGFEEAATAFHDPTALLAEDAEHSRAERRQVLLGESAAGRVLVVAFTVRGRRVRFISARPANRRERGVYAEIRRFPL